MLTHISPNSRPFLVGIVSKPIVDLAMHAANNVQDAILAAHAQEPQEAVAKLVAEVQKALALAKNLSDEFFQK